MIERLLQPDHPHTGSATTGLARSAVVRQVRPTCASAPSTKCLRNHHLRYRPLPTKTKPFGRPHSTGLATRLGTLVPLPDPFPSRALLAAHPALNKASIVFESCPRGAVLRVLELCAPTLKKGPALTGSMIPAHAFIRVNCPKPILLVLPGLL